MTNTTPLSRYVVSCELSSDCEKFHVHLTKN